MQHLYYTLFDIRAIVSVNVNNITAAPPLVEMFNCIDTVEHFN